MGLISVVTLIFTILLLTRSHMHCSAHVCVCVLIRGQHATLLGLLRPYYYVYSINVDPEP